jgi:hypothetical protein
MSSMSHSDNVLIEIVKAHLQGWLSRTPGVLVPASLYGHWPVYWVGRAQAASRSWDPRYRSMAGLKHTCPIRTVLLCPIYSLGLLSLL